MVTGSSEAPERTVLALAIGVFGVLSTAIAYSIAAERGATETFLLVLHATLLTWVGGMATLALGGASVFLETLGGRPTARWLVVGIGLGLVAFALNTLYVDALVRFVGDDADPVSAQSLLFRLSGTVLVAPLAEEWLCRGVLWIACSRASSSRGTIVTTAALFGVLHGLAGWLAIPHRFALGLALGWLRLRGGSLWPCVVAHAVNNLLAVMIAGE